PRPPLRSMLRLCRFSWPAHGIATERLLKELSQHITAPFLDQQTNRSRKKFSPKSRALRNAKKGLRHVALKKMANSVVKMANVSAVPRGLVIRHNAKPHKDSL